MITKLLNISIKKTQEPPEARPSIFFMARAAELAYSPLQVINENLPKGWNVEFFEGASTQAIALYKANTLIISFRGTEFCISDFMVDIDFRKINMSGIGKIHAGFWKALGEVLPKIFTFIETRLDQKPKTEIYLVGHSLGGALAVLLAAHLNACKIGFEQVVTLGQPRVFGRNTAKYQQNQWGHKLLRIVNYTDPIPWFPFLLQGYAHMGAVLFFDQYSRLHLKISITKRWILLLMDLVTQFAFAMYPKLKMAKFIIQSFQRHKIASYLEILKNYKGKFPKI